jgi:hypothetical protein
MRHPAASRTGTQSKPLKPLSPTRDVARETNLPAAQWRHRYPRGARLRFLDHFAKKPKIWRATKVAPRITRMRADKDNQCTFFFIRAYPRYPRRKFLFFQSLSSFSLFNFSLFTICCGSPPVPTPRTPLRKAQMPFSAGSSNDFRFFASEG